jgi:hypothetical protein
LVIFVSVILTLLVFLILEMRKRPGPSFQQLLMGDDPHCIHPCWQGITPDETSVADGLAALNTLQWVRAESISHYPMSELYSFRFYPSGVGSLYYRENTITSIVISLSHEPALSEGLELLGSPRWVTVRIDGQELAYSAQLVFPEKHIVLEAFSHYEEDKDFLSDGDSWASIYPDMRLGSIWFYPAVSDINAREILSDSLGYSLWNRGYEELIVQEWSGYGAYEGVH